MREAAATRDDSPAACRYPSLSAFYKHIQHPTGLKGVLDGYFRLEHLPRMFRILNIVDAELDQRIGRIAEAQALREMKSAAMFRGARREPGAMFR